MHQSKITRHESDNVKVLVAQSCLTLCDPNDYSLPGFSVHGIFQARKLEWVAIPFSRQSFQPRDQTWVSCIEADFLPSETQGHLLIAMLYVNYISIKKLPGIKTSSKTNYYNYTLYIKKVKILTLQKR